MADHAAQPEALGTRLNRIAQPSGIIASSRSSRSHLIVNLVPNMDRVAVSVQRDRSMRRVQSYTHPSWAAAAEPNCRIIHGLPGTRDALFCRDELLAEDLVHYLCALGGPGRISWR